MQMARTQFGRSIQQFLTTGISGGTAAGSQQQRQQQQARTTQQRQQRWDQVRHVVASEGFV
jgi:hypothetical protein